MARGNTWDGGGGDDNWGTGDNWNPNGAPGYGTLTFSGSTRTVNTNNSVGAMNKIEFNSTTPFTLRGNTLELYDFGGTQAKIENLNSGKGTIDLSIEFEATTGTRRGEINPISGDLEFNGTVNMNGSFVDEIHVYGGGSRKAIFNAAINGSSRKVIVQDYNVAEFNAAMGYTGNTEIDQGEIWIGPSGDINASSSIYLGNGAETGNDAKLFINDTDGGTTFSRTINVNGGDGSQENREVGGLNTSGTNTFSGSIVRATGGDNRTLTLYVSSGGTVSFTGVIDGDDAVIMRGPGTVWFNAAHTYNGQTYVNGGTLAFMAAAGANFSNTINLGDTSGSAAATLTIGTGGVTVTNAVEVRSGSGGTKTIGSQNGSGTAIFSGGVTLNTGVDLSAAAGGTLLITNTVSAGSAQTATAVGAGTVILAGVADNVNLALTANSGTVVLAKTSSGSVHAVGNGVTVGGGVVQLGGTGSDQIFNNTFVTVNSGRFDLAGRNETIDALSGSGGAITNSSVTAATLTVGSAGGSGTYAGQIVSGVGSIQVTKQGGGALTLSGNNSYTGQTLADAGTLNIGSATAIGAGTFNISGNITFNNTSGGALTLANNNPVTLGGSPTFTGTHDLNLGTGTFTITGANRTLAVNTGTLTVGGGVTESGTRRLRKDGAGTLVLSAAAGTWTGGSDLNVGTLAIGNNTSLGTGTLALQGGTLQSSGGARSIANVVVLTTNSTVSGSADVTFNSSGTFTFSGGSRTLTANNSGLTTLAGNVYLSNNDSSAGRTQTFAGSGNVAISAPIANNNFGNTVAVNLAYAGTGTLTLTAASSHSGETDIDSGTLALGAGGDLTATSKLYLGSGANSANATLALAANGVDLDRNIQVNTSTGAGTRTIAATATSGSVTLSGATLDVARDFTVLANSGSDLTIANTINLSFNSTHDDLTVSANDDVTLSGPILASSGAAVLNKSGGGTLTLSGDSATGVSGYVLINVTDGTLSIDHANNLGDQDAPFPDKVNFSGSDSTLAVTDDVTLNSNIGMRMDGVQVTFDVAAGKTLTMAGALAYVAGTPGIRVTGGGTFVSSGPNTYSGLSDVSDGLLVINGVATNSALTLVHTGGTLGGTGTVGALEIENGGRLAPGASVGTINAGNTTWDTNGVYVFEVNDFAGTYGSDPGWDRLNVTGVLSNTATSGEPFVIRLTSLTGTVAGPAAHFTNTMAYTRAIVTATSIDGFAANKFLIDTNDFEHDLDGGTWSIQQTGNSLELAFLPAGSGPALSAGPNLSFTTMLGSAPANQTFGITNAGTGTLTYTNNLTYGTGASGWATVTAVTGQLETAQFAIHTTAVSVVGLTGVFHATNTITGNQTNGDQQVVFTLTVTNIPPVTGATAIPDGRELVRLGWARANGLNTLVLASTNGITADPTQGANYAVGASIGAATVIYSGSATQMEHVAVPGRTNHYAFYARNGDYYAAGVGASATTDTYRAGEMVEPFAYTNGVALAGLEGGQGFSAGWVVAAQGSKLVETNTGSATVPYFPNIPNYPVLTANRLHFTDPGSGSTNRAERSFPTISTGRVYAATMLAYRWRGANKWAGISLMSNTTEKVFAGKIGHAVSQNILGLDGVGGQTPSAYELLPYGEAPGNTGKVYLVILRYDFTTQQLATKAYETTQTVPRAEPITWDATDTLGAGDIVTVDGVRVHAGSVDLANTIGDSYFDEVRVATSWYDLLNLTGPVLDVTPTTLAFTANLGQNPVVTQQTFAVSNVNAGVLSFTNLITYGAGASDWLAVTSGTGLLSGVSGSIQTASVGLAIYHFSRGTYTATNTIYGGEAGTQAVVVTLSVTGTSGRVVYEPFDTATSGVLHGTGGGFGWNNSWARNAVSPEHYYNGSPGIADFGDYCSSDGKVQLDSWTAGAGGFRESYREFTAFTGGVLYFATKINIGNTGLNREAGLKLSDGGLDKLNIGKVVASDGTGFLSALYPNGQNYVSAYQLNGAIDYLLVGRYDFASHNLRVKGFVTGSPPGASEPAAWDIDVTTTEAISSLNRIAMYTRNALNGDNPGSVLWDDVRLATTWNDLMCDLGLPQDYPVVSNATFHALDSTNTVTDEVLASGIFPISVSFYDRYGIRADSTTSPFFRPNFDLVNASGGHIVQDRFFDTTNFSANATVLVGSNATISPVTPVNIPVGPVTLRWSAINSNEAYRINMPEAADGSNLAFTVYDDDVTGPTPTLLYVGTTYTMGSIQTNITDADLANTNDMADIAVRWDDPSGVFMTNSPPHGNTNIGSENGRVIPNWDLLTSNLLTDATNVYGFDQVFTDFVGDNGAQSVTTIYFNAFAITNIDFNYVFYLTASAEDDDNDRGTYADPGADGDDVPWDRTVITNALSFLGVTDDDSAPPAASAVRIFGNSRGTGLVTGSELAAGGWSITGLVQDVYSGLRVNGASTNVPDNSPFLRIFDPEGALRLTTAFTNGIVNGETNARPFNLTGLTVVGGIQGGVWTAQIIMSDIDADRLDDGLTGTNSFTFDVATFEWDAGAGVDRDWSNRTNWTADVEPGATDAAFVNGGYTALVTQAGERAFDLWVGNDGFDGGNDGGTGTVEQTAGVLGIANAFTLGESPGDLGQFFISGGSLTVTGATTVGSAGVGQLVVSGAGAVTAIGNLTVGEGSAGGGEDFGSTLSVAGGSVSAQMGVYVGLNSGADGTLAISGGTVGVTDALILGADPGSTGRVTMTAGLLNAGGAGAGEHLFVGSGGYGEMALSGSATVRVANGKDVVIGEAGNSADVVSLVTVDAGALLAVSRTIEVGLGAGGRGALQVSGGEVNVTNALTIGNAGGATGTVTVSSGMLQVLGDLTVGSNGRGTLTVAGGSVTAAVVRVSDVAGGSVVNLTGGRLVTAGAGDFNVDLDGTVNVSGGELVTDRIDLGTNGVATLNLSGGTITAGNNVNVAAGVNATGVVNQTGGTLLLAPNRSLDIGSEGATGNRYGFYSITNGTLTLSGTGDIDVGDTDSATGRGVFHVLGAAPNVSVEDDLIMSSLGNSELQFTLRDSAIAAIVVSNDITLAGTLTVSNIGAVAAGSYVILTNVNAGGNDIIGAFAATNWAGGVTGRVVVSTHDVSLLFGPVMAVLGTNAAVTIPDGDTTPTAVDGTLFTNVVADTIVDRIFTVTNLNATYTLNLTNASPVVISGSTNFTVFSQPVVTNLSGGAESTFTIRFAPDVVGVYTATVSVANDDTQQDPYNFAIAGNGVLATEPTLPSSNLVFSAVSNAQMTVSWASGDGAGRLLVARVGSTVTDVPLDGIGYAANSVHSNGAAIAAGVYVVYNASGTNVTVTGLYPGTTYAFALFEYNGSNGGINYLTTNVLTGAQATLTYAPVITEGLTVNVSMSENGDPTPFSLTLNATDADTPYGDVIHWAVYSTPFHGVAAADGTGGSVSVDYTPAPYHSGTDSFVVEAYDNFGNRDTITVQVTITEVNVPGKVFYLFE